MTAENSVDNASLEEVTQWIKDMGERGTYQPTTARHRITALERLTSVLADDEPKDARYVLENIETICDRWTRKENANPSTANTYLSRSRIALSDFFEYRNDPRGFKGRGKGTRGERAERAPKKEASGNGAAELNVAKSSESPPSSEVVRVADRDSLRTFPVAGGEFLYKLPEGATMADIRKIAFHLVTFATDFGEGEMPSFSMVRQDAR